jgi:hypothetical protein
VPGQAYSRIAGAGNRCKAAEDSNREAAVIRLEHLCDMELEYTGGLTLLQPYGGEEGRGFGSGDGWVTGAEFSGRVRWFNQPRRRGDGALVTEAAGLILTDEQIPLLFSLRGPLVGAHALAEPDKPQVLAAVFEVEEARFQWLNQCLCLAEGSVHPESLHLQLRVYVCRFEESRPSGGGHT